MRRRYYLPAAVLAAVLIVAAFPASPADANQLTPLDVDRIVRALEGIERELTSIRRTLD